MVFCLIDFWFCILVFDLRWGERRGEIGVERKGKVKKEDLLKCYND